ncbi:MAG: vacuolar protein sorting-associated protein 35 [Candidatus Thalassarchaeaceae archaeon]|nr:vacuolar protein sorting-associated protein 35 [Candidatus Thalassarchaeaceae archaeon]
MSGRLLPSEDPIAETVLEWTIARDSRDIRQLMVWLEESEGRKERSVFMNRALDLMDEIQYALARLDELR